MTTRGKLVLTIILLGVVGFGVYRWWDKIAPQTRPQNVSIDVAKVKEERGGIRAGEVPDHGVGDAFGVRQGRSSGLEVIHFGCAGIADGVEDNFLGLLDFGDGVLADNFGKVQARLGHPWRRDGLNLVFVGQEVGRCVVFAAGVVDQE